MSLDALVERVTSRLSDVVTVHHPASFASSFGMEDMVILDLLARLELKVEVFTLDTGRMHEETHQLIEVARQRYGQPIRVMYPDQSELECFIAANGTNAFYESVDLRKQCCAIRKIAPLRRALQGKNLWITGMRRQQSATRAELDLLFYDRDHGLFKLNPLVEWTTQEVAEYVRVHNVPVNTLHAQGYPSIGCAPCTRAVQPGEDERAGRWWWEQAESRECGLHLDPSGRPVPAENSSVSEVST